MRNLRILCVCLSATIQRTLKFDELKAGSVNRTSDFREDASGKATNSARVLTELEAEAAVFCPLGTENSERFLKLAERDALRVIPVFIEGNVRECWTLLGKSGETTEIVADEPDGLSQEAGRAVTEKFSACVGEFDAVLFSGSCPKIFDPSIVQEICETAKKNGKFLLADFSGKNLLDALSSPESRPDAVKINEEEFNSTFVDLNDCSRKTLEEKILEISERFSSIIAVTRGEKPTVAARNGKIFTCESEKILPVNTTACGDSFNAGFLSEYLASGSLQAALEKGTWCAARNAESAVPGSIQ